MTDKPISKSKRAYARTEARLAIIGAVTKLYEELVASGKINQSRIAERLGVSRSRISRLLSGPGNWTIDTVGDLLAAMDSKITDVHVRPLAEIAVPNTLHDWLAVPEADIRIRTAVRPVRGGGRGVQLPNSIVSTERPKVRWQQNAA